MSVKKKILIALPFGQTIRDVLRSDTFKVLKEQKSVTLIVVSSASKDESFQHEFCLLYTSPSPRDQRGSRMPSSA